MISEAIFIKKVEKELRNVFKTFQPEDVKSEILSQSAHHLTMTANAKRARPALVYMFGKKLNLNTNHLTEIAVASELIHAASLLHDDIIDEGTIRRGKPTVNVLHGNVTAVLTGDLMFSHALQQLALIDKQVLLEAVRVVKEMTIASSLEYEARANLNLTEQEWMNIANGKTGCLFGWCGQAPALLSKDKELSNAYDNCGRHLGIAFQIADDIKDFYSEKPGKRKFADVYNRNPNFVLMKSIEFNPLLKKKIQDLWSKKTISEVKLKKIGEEILKSEAIEYSFNQVEKEIITSLESLSSVDIESSQKELIKWIKKMYKDFSSKIITNEKTFLKKIKNKVIF